MFSGWRKLCGQSRPGWSGQDLGRRNKERSDCPRWGRGTALLACCCKHGPKCKHGPHPPLLFANGSMQFFHCKLSIRIWADISCSYSSRSLGKKKGLHLSMRYSRLAEQWVSMIAVTSTCYLRSYTNHVTQGLCSITSVDVDILNELMRKASSLLGIVLDSLTTHLIVSP